MIIYCDQLVLAGNIDYLNGAILQIGLLYHSCNMDPSEIQLCVGLIADTHGLLRPEAEAALQGAQLIIHAGDVGKPEILEKLRQIAPVMAIRGNVDRGEWAEALPTTEAVEVSGATLYVIHDLEAMDLDPQAAGFQAVISGHSHQPEIERRCGALFVNPGSAGPRRFRLPVTLARLTIRAGEVEAEIVELAV